MGAKLITLSFRLKKTREKITCCDFIACSTSYTIAFHSRPCSYSTKDSGQIEIGVSYSRIPTIHKILRIKEGVWKALQNCINGKWSFSEELYSSTVPIRSLKSLESLRSLNLKTECER